jgi:YHS domain-containing protein
MLAAPVLSSAIAGNGQVVLSWNSVATAIDYTVQFGTSPGSHMYSVYAPSTTSTITELANGTTYYFAVIANNNSGESGKSNEKNATPQAPVLTATLLNSATAGNGQVVLNWNSVAGATSYTVKYGTSAGTYPTNVAVGNVTTRTVTGLTNGTTYYFVVVANNSAGPSGNSNEKNAIPQISVPAAVVLNSAIAGNGQVVLNWNSVAGATSYTVKYGTSKGIYPSSILAGNLTTRTVTGLTNGTNYYFVVVANNSAGPSGNSNEKNATPQFPVPAAPVLASAIAGNGQVVLSWNSVATAIDYTVQFGTSPGSHMYSVYAPSTTSTITELSNGTTYYFSVVANNNSGESVNSNEKNATPRN